MSTATSARRRTKAPPSTRWRQWQGSSVSQRLLAEEVRQLGYSVVYVPPPLRETFLDVAQVLRLYDTLYHKPKRTLSSDQLRQLAEWAMATQALMTVLQEEAYD